MHCLLISCRNITENNYLYKVVGEDNIIPSDVHNSLLCYLKGRVVNENSLVFRACLFSYLNFNDSIDLSYYKLVE